MEDAMSEQAEMVKRQETTIDETSASAGHFHRAVPVVDVYENDDEILILADMPGVNADSLKIQLEADELDIRGTQRTPTGSDSSYVPFEYRRIFSVPQTIDPESVTAELTAGVLRVTLGKSADAKPQRIEIQSQ
jgi:HSP20 family molecular chaperone IbpA